MPPAFSVLFLGSYPPRQCGIAAFTHDLASALGKESGCSFQVAAVTPPGRSYDYPPEVAFEIRQDQAADYRHAALLANRSPADVLSVQHEFGLFGGPAGNYVSEMLRHVEKPVVTTLHTVLGRPSPEYRSATLELIRYSDRLVVMSEVSRRILIERYGAPADRIVLIPHGVPEMPEADPEALRRELGLEGRFVVLTFGLLSRNKGIELVLEALPAVIGRHPEVLYVVLGATHPEVRRREGEGYRLFLEGKVRELGLSDHVRFINRFVDSDALIRYIQASDVYATPYLNEEQVVSGTLSYALAMGKPIVSTPYWYARELLAEGRGMLVPFGDAPAMARAIARLVEDEETYGQIALAAKRYGRRMMWPEVARQYAWIFGEVAAAAGGRRAPVWPSAEVVSPLALPEVRLDHLHRLSDETGLIQHATYGVPDPKFGYSSDDAGRALAVLLFVYERQGGADALALVARYMTFLRYAQTDDGHFHNFVGYDRRFLDDRGSEDTLGRVVWGLGHVVRAAPDAGMRRLARQMMEEARPHLERLTYPRAKAYAIMGLVAFLEAHPDARPWRALVARLGEDLADLYEENARPGWEWFEPTLTYGNAKLCEALLAAHQATGDERLRRVGLLSLDFLWDYLWNGTYIDLVGNQGWASRDGNRAVFGQQPIDAGYLVEACVRAHAVTGDVRYARAARHAFEWFFGRNRLGQPLYEPDSGAVSDGLDPEGKSPNQGAESVICYLLARLAMDQLSEVPADGPEPAVAPVHAVRQEGPVPVQADQAV
ncbi:MAG: glycosyltransferase [Firmicutes bacterium]|nr:glycosyltransferase [Bacillota bacterium]